MNPSGGARHADPSCHEGSKRVTWVMLALQLIYLGQFKGGLQKAALHAGFPLTCAGGQSLDPGAGAARRGASEPHTWDTKPARAFHHLPLRRHSRAAPLNNNICVPSSAAC